MSSLSWYQVVLHITSFNPLTTNWSWRFWYLWCHFQQCPFGDRFCFSRKGGKWVGAPKGCKQHGCFWAWLSTRWATSLLLCMNRLRKQCSGLVGPPFLSHGHSLAMSRDYCELINKWVWFESWICREWLQQQLAEVLNVKTQGNGEYGTFKGPMSLKWPLQN